MTAPPRGTAVVATRADRGPIDTTEIEGLVEAAGYDVAAVLTQVRPEAPGTHIGAGKVDELVDTVDRTEADLVVIDGEVTSGQARNLALALPEGCQLRDRYRLVLDIFAEQATDRRAVAQVELARLEYQLDWYEAVADEGAFTRMTEKGSLRYQLEDRIDALRRELDELGDPADRLRERRREEGFDLVTIAGYTNAGKSTLLHRLADDLSLEAARDDHPDRDTPAAIEDRLFKTLGTTTRRATLRGRPVLCTDTVGYVRDLPHDLVVSFAETLSEAGAADVVLLVTDATDDHDDFVEKLAVSEAVLDAQDVDTDRVVPVINKLDLADATELAARRERLASAFGEPVTISAVTGDNIDDLVDAVVERLPTEQARLSTPYTDDAMALVSDAYDRAVVRDIDYDGGGVDITVEGRPSVIDELRRQADDIAAQLH